MTVPTIAQVRKAVVRGDVPPLCAHAWAEKKAKTHDQERCPGCGLWKVWKKKPGWSEEPLALNSPQAVKRDVG